jgi:hypothetical protein
MVDPRELEKIAVQRTIEMIFAVLASGMGARLVEQAGQMDVSAKADSWTSRWVLG